MSLRLPHSRPAAPKTFKTSIWRYSVGRLLVAVILSLWGCTGIEKDTSSEAATAVDIAQSPNDDRQYRYLTLANQMQVLLVSDPDTDKAAASLVVARGSFHEPEDRPGIAHFLEHMLFIGTEKYPEVDAYQKFVGTNGGSSNAYTALDHTNYFFDINPAQFREGMDRFAQFFIGPLFDDQYVEREKNAVYSEYQLQSKDEGWRANAAQKLALNQAHPASRFTIGSLDTLNGDIRRDLLTFFSENYSADQMVLVALGNESLDTLQSWVAPLFEQVTNREIGPPPALPELFEAAQLPATMNIESVKQKHRLTFEFPVPNTRQYFRNKPLLYITNLLGHEGDGSLHQALKAQGLIESLATGNTEVDINTSIVSVDIELTEAGYQQVPAITEALFDQIALLNSQPPSRRLFDEQAQMLTLAFRFQEPSSPTGFVYRTAPQLLHTEPAEVLRAPYLMSDFDPDLIKRYLSYLTPENVLRTVSGPEVATTDIEPWFQVPYALNVAALTRDAKYETALKLPVANQFLPERVDLVTTTTAAQPALAYDKDGIELWVAPDTQFGSPRSNAFLTLAVPGGFNAPGDIVKARLYSQLVADSLNEFAYPAYLAGLSYRVSVSASGFEVRLSGYDDKQPLLLDKVLNAFATLEIDPERLAINKAELSADWRGFSTERPYTQTMAALSNLLVSNSWPPNRLADEIDRVDVRAMRQWADKVTAKVTVQGLLHGNVRTDRPRQVAAALREHLSLSNFAVARSQIFSNPAAVRYAVDIEHQDASMILYLQNSDTSYQSQAATALAAQLVRQAYFTELRTKDQLGYVVGASYRAYRNHPGVVFVVQSPVADPKQLTDRTYRFLDEQIETVAGLGAEEFAAYKTGLISNLTERPKNLSERSGRLWSDLQLDETAFNSRSQLAEAVAKINQAEAVATLKDLRKRLPEQQLLVYNTGKFSVEPERGAAIESVTALKGS